MIKRFLVALAFLPGVAQADINEKLEKFFEEAGLAINVTSGEIYKGQKAGYTTAGGITVKGRILDTKPLTVSLPHLDAGCGGIDIFSGGFTFINDQQLIETLKSIASSAQGYAFMLGLETVSPQVAGVIKTLQSWSNTINTYNINSCEMAQAAVGSIWPRRAMVSQEICKRSASKDGLQTNYLKARRECAQEDQFKKQMKDQSHVSFGGEQFNIAWECIQKEPFLASDMQAAEFFMSLMGTVIFRKEESGVVVDVKPSKIGDESFLRAMLEGGRTTIYVCDNEKKSLERTLYLKEKEVDCSTSLSWFAKIRTQLLDMQDKILADEELSPQQIALLNKSRLPLYKIVNVMTAYKKGSCPIDLYHVSDIVAMDLLMQFFREAVEAVRRGAIQFRNEKMFGAGEIEDYLLELRRVEDKITYYENRSMQLFEREMLMLEKIKMLEEQLRAEFAGSL